MKTRFNKFIAAALLSVVGISAVPKVAEAHVINCWHNDYYAYSIGRCGGTDGNPPYTTQFALMVPCDNGTRTSGWYPAGYYASVIAQCDSGHHRTSSAYFLFK